jgi:inactive STAND/TIR domain
MADPIAGFISYSHKDQELLAEFKSHLASLERPGLFSGWTDHMIEPGSRWEENILKQLKRARIILFLVSSDFIASDYIHDVEIKEAMKRDENGQTRVIPIILRSVVWENTPFSKLQALPDWGKPINDMAYWENRDKAFVEVVKGIARAIDEIIGQSAASETGSKELLPKGMLHEALLSLNYKQQTKTFREVIEKKPHVGAFLIHGGLDYGQIWLLHRLVNNTSVRNVDKPLFRFPLRRRACGVTLEALWRSLGKWVNGHNPPKSPQIIAERIYELWKKQSIILILDDLDQVSENYLQMFLQEFWIPLVDIISKHAGDIPRYYLLLFLIDNKGRVEHWQVPWKTQLDRPEAPVKLPKLRPFSPKDIDDWVENEVNRLPSHLTVNSILEKGNNPRMVLQHICELCGHDWYERESEWLETYGNIR